MISTIAGFALKAFFSMSGMTQLFTIGAILLTLGGVYAGWHKHVAGKAYNRGYDKAIADVASANKEAIGRATAARSSMRDCAARGMRWSTVTGKCQ